MFLSQKSKNNLIKKEGKMKLYYHKTDGREMSGAICGGVMSNSQMKRGMKKYGAYFGMMSFVMADKHYKKFIALKKQNKDKEATKIFDRYAISQI
jgi:hypothetical protein